MKNIFFFIIGLFTLSQINAQVIGGKVIRIDNRERIPFASLSIEGTTLGISTDFEGNFIYEVPTKYNKGTLIISCIGYKDRFMDIKSLLGNLDIEIELESQNVEIEEVVVEDKSMFPYTIVKKCIQSGSKNYMNKDYNYVFLYKNIDIYSNAVTKTREAYIKTYDKKGYRKTNVHDEYNSVNYEFICSKRDFDVHNITDGNTNLDDVLEGDVARFSDNVLNLKHLYDYEISIKDMINYQGDSVYVIVFNCINPDLVKTGNFQAYHYSGEIFITKNEFAVVYMKSLTISRGYSGISENLYYINNSTGIDIEKAEIETEVRYSKKNGKFVPERINYSTNFGYQKNNSEKLIKRKSELKLISIETDQPEIIETRNYFENMNFNELEWNKLSEKE